jgi:uroporphyrinogen-III synthase
MTRSTPSSEPLAGRRLLVTRAAHQAHELTVALAARGAEVVPCPVLRIEATRAAAPDLADLDWLVVTSPNGVDHLADLVAGTAWPPSLRLAVVGPGTAARARDQGWPVALQPATATGEGLAAAFAPVSGLAGARVLRVRGDRAPAVVEETLRDLGARVEALTVYRTVAAPPPEAALDALAAGRLHAVVFASGSAIDALLAAAAPLDLPATLPAVCIGPVTAAHAARLRWRRLETAAEPTAEGVADAAVRLLAAADG